MNAHPTQALGTSPVQTSIAAKMLNLLVSPTLVFDEVLASPLTIANWLVPMVLACLSSLLVLGITSDPAPMTNGAALSTHWAGVASLALCASVLLGTLWCGLVLWLIGRFLLKSRFEFAKALEVAGLSATIMVLAAVTTALLTLAVGNPSARPDLSLLCSNLASDSPLLAVASVFNVFHLWAASVLAIGLARLAKVSLMEAAFWVFGFWIFGRIGLIILS
jgi:Yip1-like protein